MFLYFDESILEIPLVGCCLGKLTTKLATTIFDDLVEAYCYSRQSTALDTETADCDSLEQSLSLKLANSTVEPVGTSLRLFGEVSS